MLLITLTQNQLTDPLLGQVPHLRVPELRELRSAGAFLMLMVESRQYLITPTTPAGDPFRAPAE